jgi:CelD/BcsL family acetyltransferase involved in cellulose biosynthesis
VWPLTIRRRGAFRILEPLGAGRSDWLDVPVDPSWRTAALSAFLDYLLAHRREWDLIEHRDVLADSPLIPVLVRLCAASGLNCRKEARSVSPYLNISGTWEEFLKGKRKKFRSNLKYYRRVAERNGKRLTTRRVEQLDSDQVVTALKTIELKSWKAREGNLKVNTPAGERFYRGFCRYFIDLGFLELWRADIDGSEVSLLLNIVHREKCYHYNSWYDEKYAHISPGLILQAEAIADAFDRKLTEYDFLSGNESYKGRWSSDERTIEHVVLFSNRPLSILAYLILVASRRQFRRSTTLRSARAKLLLATRRLFRGRGNLEK